MSGTSSNNPRHTIKIVIGPRVFDTVVTLDGEELPNVTGIRVSARRSGAQIELTMEHVEVVIEGELPRKRVVERTDTYEVE